MNPPSAIHGAMSRDRKPFTYTPGGLDLSEIKSERMAKRLMRNAMNQGVPEVSNQSIQSPLMPSTPIAVPNFNCLPVQVFPTFNLPANPKSLLRTRSNPDQPKDPSVQRVPPPSQFVNNSKSPGVLNYDTFSKPAMTYSQINNNRPVSMYEYGTTPVREYSKPRINHVSDVYSAPELPEICYDVEYFRVPSNIDVNTDNSITASVKYDGGNNKSMNENPDSVIDLSINPSTMRSNPATVIINPVEGEVGTDNKQREVKVVKKTVKKEQKVEEQNGEQNGDTNIEAELTVKLPTKKTGAKTETKVEVVKKILPDGSVEEVKTTTTKTTVDGKTEIKTRTETRTLPKEEADEEIEVEEEEEEEQEEQEQSVILVQEVEDENEETDEPEVVVKKTATEENPSIKENGFDGKIVKTEERSETTTTTTKKVVVVQSDNEEPAEEIDVEEEEIEEEEEIVQDTEPVIVDIKKQHVEPTTTGVESKEIEVDEKKEEEEEEVEEEDEVQTVEDNKMKTDMEKERELEQDVEEEEEEYEEEVNIPIKEVEAKPTQNGDNLDDEEEEEFEEAEEKPVETQIEVKVEKEVESTQKIVIKKDEPIKEVIDIVKENEPEKTDANLIEVSTKHEIIKEDIPDQITDSKEEKQEPKAEDPEPAPQTESKVPLREPSIPLEKVEDVEIKPIGPAEIITKTHTEKTEIVTSSTVPPPGVLSTQTEYNRVENIVTVNRTTKTLDNAYENINQQGIPTVKTYFAPNVDRVLTSPMLSKPYQPVYTPEPTTERRHSLLLERLSMERQMPSEIYHYNNQNNYEQQRQYSQEPQAEVLTISNVKPSKITNQQWYQQSKDNVLYNNVTPTSATPTQTWSQPQPKPQPQPTYKPQPAYPPQQSYQPPPTPQPQPQYPSPYIEPTQDKISNTYTAYTPKPSNWTNSNLETTPSINMQPNQYSFLNKDSSKTYQKTQQYTSSYVPPPWEQDSSYVVDNSTQNYYQLPPNNTFASSPAPTQSWKPTPAANKFSKPPPTAYIPPAPNQSFVKSVSDTEPPRPLPGRKTYYSEYERRYISVPEATYIPHETKYQPQPDPSPQFYYDNNEPTETVEHQWRKELREFTEKTSQTQTQIDQTNVNPPWEVDSKYAKTPAATYTPTPTWSQTLRPRSWRERSFESEFVGSQEWPKTNTLGRARPMSTYGKHEPILERTRGVSVDRYNPNNYQSPTSLEHPPVQTHTLPIPAPHSTYHNPNVPAYHSRASAEPREQPASYKQPRALREARASPFQSRSFKYLQWITGTDD